MSLKQGAVSVSKTAFANSVKNENPFPAYFFSHGGPSFLYNDDMGSLGAWKTVKKIGKTIKKQYKPDYIIVVSAHWQSKGSNLIEIAVPSVPHGENKLIYDFYGFPDYMFKEEFHTKNSESIAAKIRQHLEESGFESKLTKRGIDHGVWVPFKVAFSDYTELEGKKLAPGELDLLETAIIQVSLPANDTDFATQFKLGQTLNAFRENNVWDEASQKHATGLVICSGMSVHNLRDLGYAFRLPGPMPYVKPFNQLLTKIMTTKSPLLSDFEDIKKYNRELLYKAHPTLEHFAPAVVGAGLASEKKEVITELYNEETASLGWGIYQFGTYK